jgi:hypothetical protein
MSENLTTELPPDRIGLILTQLGSIGGQVTTLGTRLEWLENRVDQRLLETRPIWEQVLSQLQGVSDRLELVETLQADFGGRLSGFDEKLSGFDEKLSGFDEKLSGFDERLLAFDVKLSGFDKRLSRVEVSIADLALDTRAGFKRMSGLIETATSLFLEVRKDQGDLERRMDRAEDKLETKPNI